MNLSQIHDILQNADDTSWHRRAEGGPTFRYRLSSFTGHAGPGVDVDDHPFWAVYRSDVNLTLGWGMSTSQRPGNSLAFDWQKNFIDQDVSSMFADVFWAGALIDRFRLLYIDGGHFLQPHTRTLATDADGLPSETQHVLTRWEVEFGELLSLLERGSSSRDHVDRAGIDVVAGGPYRP